MAVSIMFHVTHEESSKTDEYPTHLCLSSIVECYWEDPTILLLLFFWRGGGGGGEALIERFHLGNIFFIKKAENFTLIKVFS